MRERGPGFRKRSSPQLNAAGRDGMVVALYVLGGVLMAHVGAFHTGEVSPWIRYPYFVGINLVGALCALGVAAILVRRVWFARRPVARGAVEALAVTLLLTPLVWLLAAWVLNGDPHPVRLVHLAGQVAPVAALFAPVGLLARRSPPIDPMPPAQSESQPAPFQDLLPALLREATLLAVEAEDHYLNIHTDRGSALVSLRLADALERLAGARGARTHRSWWVARGAVVGVSRGRGRAILQLSNGLRAPVSRTYAPALRREGWFALKASG